MTIKDFIYTVCQEKEYSVSKFAEEIEINENTLRSILKRNDGMGISVFKFAEILEKLEMQLVVESCTSEEDYIIDGESEGISSK